MCKASSNTFYGLGFLGALIYNIQYADGVTEFLWGIMKSILWPAFVMYEVLSILQI